MSNAPENAQGQEKLVIQEQLVRNYVAQEQYDKAEPLLRAIMKESKAPWQRDNALPGT